MVKGYKFKNNQPIYFYPSTLDKYDGAGNIYISTDDMAKLVSQFKSNKLLSKSSTDNLLSQASTNLYLALIDMDFIVTLITKDTEAYFIKMIL